MVFLARIHTCQSDIEHPDAKAMARRVDLAGTFCSWENGMQSKRACSTATSCYGAATHPELVYGRHVFRNINYGRTGRYCPRQGPATSRFTEIVLLVVACGSDGPIGATIFTLLTSTILGAHQSARRAACLSEIRLG